MSARLVHCAPATRIEHGGMIDARGNARCLDCRELDRSAWTEHHNLVGVCDGCSRAFTECTPLEISGTTTVEYPGCTIF